MKNLYQPSSLLTKSEFKKIEKALENAWSQETTNPDVKNEWTEDNKAYGQCAITSLIIYDMFGGKLIYDKENFHIWNELPDKSQQDFSRKQFLNERTFSIYKYKTKEDILFDENGVRTKTNKRYKLLSKRFNNEFEKLKKQNI